MEPDLFEEIHGELHGESGGQVLNRINESTVKFGGADPEMFYEMDEEEGQ